MLADYCAPPGRPLTDKGNLRLADARHLVDVLDTGDDPELGGYRKLQSAEDLPSLSRLVRLALDAGVVRRNQGKLVAVARFAALDEVTAYEKVVRAAVAAGLSGPPGVYFPAMEPVRAVADECVIGLLADLLDAGSAGIPAGVLVDSMAEFVDANFHELPDLLAGLVPGWVRTQIERLEDLGVVTIADGNVTLTAAGVPISIGLVEAEGVEVLLRPDPTTCDASAIVDLLGALDEQEWTADASTWLAARPDPVAAAGELVDEVCAEGRDPVVVVAGLIAVPTSPARTPSPRRTASSAAHTTGWCCTGWRSDRRSTRRRSSRSGSSPDSWTSSPWYSTPTVRQRWWARSVTPSRTSSSNSSTASGASTTPACPMSSRRSGPTIRSRPSRSQPARQWCDTAAERPARQCADAPP